MERELSDACKRGVYDVVCYLLETVPGLNVNWKDSTGSTPLMKACSSGRLDIVRRLVEAGADVDVRNNDGNTALCWACWCSPNGSREEEDYINVVRYLICECRANVNLASDSKKTALMRSCQLRSLEMIRLLVENGANVNASTQSGWTPLMFVCVRGSSVCLDIVRYLVIKGGARVSACNEKGEMAINMPRIKPAVFSFLLRMMGGPGSFVPETWRGA